MVGLRRRSRRTSRRRAAATSAPASTSSAAYTPGASSDEQGEDAHEPAQRVHPQQEREPRRAAAAQIVLVVAQVGQRPGRGRHRLGGRGIGGRGALEMSGSRHPRVVNAGAHRKVRPTSRGRAAPRRPIGRWCAGGPSRRPTFGSQPSSSRARPMSGRRCWGSSVGQRLVDDLRPRPRHLDDRLGQLEERELVRVADVHRQVLAGLRQRDHARRSGRRRNRTSGSGCRRRTR